MRLKEAVSSEGVNFTRATSEKLTDDILDPPKISYRTWRDYSTPHTGQKLIGDVTGDGIPDFLEEVSTCIHSSVPRDEYCAWAETELLLTAGEYQDATRIVPSNNVYTLANTNLSHVTVQDFNNDGLLDISFREYIRGGSKLSPIQVILFNKNWPTCE
ncbi:MAG: hypothetical protein HYY43_03530 [Deltaproteobacteria bacterium]|nr:hypothetical protein [Deltaproteobacteria bacterium]MBI2342538.1 hypothetical protein [Deltaproteobacteria bacterium]MBI2974640.1 hypothetical protein [Deltaproteobacteria bacterium]